ncbi:MAG: sensor histidine kinase [Thermochromatium sp.]
MKATPTRRLLARLARIPRSSIFRLAVLYVLLLAGSVGILLGFIYWSTAGYMDRQTTETIEAEIRDLAEQYRRRGLVGLTGLISERVARDPVGASVYLLVDERFERVVGNLDHWPSESPDAEGWIRFRLREWGTDHAEEHEARAQVFLLRSGLMLLVGRDVRDLEATRRLILDALTWGLAITLALALAGAWLISATLTRRLDAINQTSREIMEGDLTRRIPVSGSGDDFDRLADGLNRMLDRIEALMAGVRQVSDNIAHDLRTPLTRLRNTLELLAATLPESGEARLLAEKAITDAEELLATFNALLRIARLESGSWRAAFGPVDLVPLIEDLVELYEPLAAEREQRLDWTAGASSIVVEGDRDLLFQVMANLVDNAIKYTQPGGHIQLTVETTDGQALVVVADNGPGIPPEFREQVFQRFFRIDDSRGTPGSGLGLSLVQAIVTLHRAHIELSDNQPGLRVSLSFRRSSQLSPRPSA